MRQASWSNMVMPHMSAPVSGFGMKVRSETGCVGDVMIALDRAARRRHFLDRDDRLAGAPVEHVEVALLGRPDQRRNTTPSAVVMSISAGCAGTSMSQRS